MITSPQHLRRRVQKEIDFDFLEEIVEACFPLWCSKMRLQRSKTVIHGCGLRTRCVEFTKKGKGIAFPVFS